MAAQGSVRKHHAPHGATRLLWAAMLLAAGLSLAATLAALAAGARHASPLSPLAADQAAAREERIAFFEARAAADPLDFLSLNTLAGEYLQRARETGDVADYERAEAAAEQSLNIVPNDNYAGLVLLGSVRLVQHDYSAVKDLARRAMPLKPAGPDAYGLLADAQTGLGDYRGAAETLATMRDLDGGLPALSRQAHLAFLTGDRINTVAYWQQAIDTSEGLPLESQAWARVQLGVTYFALGDYGAAANQHEAALELYPGYVHALAGLGQTRAAEERWDEAISAYEQAVTVQPLPQYVTALGDVYAAAGRPEQAEEQYALVDAIAGLYREAGVNTDLQIAGFYADHDRNLDQALAMAQAAYEQAPNAYAADALAWALYKNGRAPEADAYAREALNAGTLEAGFYYHAALIRLALDDEPGARDLLSQALALNPRFSPLRADEARALLTSLEAN
jgi:tetratricopeptide (TPR) repeat protein